MDSDASGEYITLVVQLRANDDGTWHVHVDQATTSQDFPLVPQTLVARVWRSFGTGIVRGSIRLHNSDQWAPIQSNGQLEALIRAWLRPGDATAGKP